MNSKLDLFLESFNNATLVTTKGAYGGRWPMPFFTNTEIESITGKDLADFFIRLIGEFKKRGISREELAQKLNYPSRFSRPIYSFPQLKYDKYPLEKLGEITLFVSELMYPFYKDDLYCKGWTNILWNKEQIEKTFQREKLLSTEGLENKSKLLQYNGYLRTITEILYFYWDTLGHEIHGPYNLDSGEILLVREWHNLNPGYFEFPKDFSFDKVTIYEVYKPGTEIKIDVSNRVFIDSRMDECLIGFYFDVSGKILLLEETKSMIQEIKRMCEKGVKEISTMSQKELLEKVVYMQFYSLKPFADFLGVSWKPPEESMKKIEKGITDKNREMAKKLMRLDLNEKTIAQLFDYRLKLPTSFHG